MKGMTVNEIEALSYRLVEVVGQDKCDEKAQHIAEQLYNADFEAKQDIILEEYVYAGIVAGLMLAYETAGTPQGKQNIF